MKEKTIISGCTLAATLLGYYYGQNRSKGCSSFYDDCGFAGAVVGELIVETLKKKPKGDGNTNH